MTVNAIPTQLPRTWRGEMGALLLLGGPMALTQIVQFSIYTIDTIMIGRVGTDSLAAAAIGSVIYFLLWMVGAGPVSAVTPMVSQAIGTTIGDTDSDARRDARRSVRMALWLVALLTLPMLGVLLFAEDLLVFFGQDPDIACMAQAYVLVLAPGLPFALGVMVLRNFLAALNKTMVPLFLVTLSVAINAALNAVLIFGLLGAPALGLV
ncbi:MAG: MATE family efflux transporter, partial [Pseudomonadota bacterium]